MYTVYLDGELLYHPNIKERSIEKTKLELEVNKTGAFKFQVRNINPRYPYIYKMKSIVKVMDDNHRLFRGRVLNAKRGFFNELQVTCEGELAFFNDSKVRPYTFQGSVDEYFRFLVEQHNEQVSEEKRFIPGNCTVTDPNDYITRENSNYPNTLNELKEKLVDILGGYLWTREEEDGIYIDYLEDFTLTNTQEIRFGENLIDFEEVIKGQDIATAIIPLGCKITDDQGNETDERLTISSVNDGVDYVFEQSAVDKYGLIYEVVVWDDVTVPENLLNKGREELQKYVNLTRSIELTAINLHHVNCDIQSFRYGRYSRIISEPHDLSESLLTRRLEINLLDPKDGLLRLGDERTTFVDKQVETGNKTSNALNVAINAQDKASEAKKSVDDATAELRETITTQSTSIIKDCESIILEATKNYTETGDFETYKEDVNAQLKLLSEQLELKFTETVQQLENVNGDLQSQINTITKYFTFDVNGITIGQVDNPYKVIIDNDRYSMTVNGVEVMWIADGKVFTPEIEVTTAFKLLNYLIDMDDSGNVNCSYVGGE